MLRAMYSIPYSSVEAITRIFARITGIISVYNTNKFRSIWRIVPIIPDFNERPVYCAIDSKGFRITISDYRGSKLKRRRRGWSKLYNLI